MKYKKQINAELKQIARNIPYNKAIIKCANIFQAISFQLTMVPKKVANRNIAIEGHKGLEFKVEIFEPSDMKEKLPCLIYVHGGAFSYKASAYHKKLACIYAIKAKCKLIRPAYMPIIEVADYQDKKFIVLWCPGGETRPYSSPKTMEKDNKERIHYIRKGSNTIEPSNEDEKELFGLANRVPFDDRVNHQAEISDLNITLIQNYLKEVNSSLYEKSKTGDFIEVCRDMNIISNLPEYIKPKNVGLMFFSMEPDKFFP